MKRLSQTFAPDFCTSDLQRLPQLATNSKQSLRFSHQHLQGQEQVHEEGSSSLYVQPYCLSSVRNGGQNLIVN